MIQFSQLNQHARIDIHRSERANSIGTTFISELSSCLDKVEHNHHKNNQAIRFLLIGAKPVGQNKDIWVAGGDLKELDLLQSQKQGRAYAQNMGALLQRLERLPFPSIAVVDGQAIGGGAELALACDLVVGTTSTKFVFKQLSLGLTCGYGSTPRLIAKLGICKTTQLLFLEQTISAEEALSLHLISACENSSEKAWAKAEQMGKKMSSLSMEALAAQKRMLYRGLQHNLERENPKEWDEFEKLWKSKQHQLQLNSFLKKESS